jgi:hypothetical protein
MRDLEPADIDKLIAVKGMIIRTSTVIPELEEGLCLTTFLITNSSLLCLFGLPVKRRSCQKQR